MKKIELLAPAGDLERLKIAIMYGADAVFIGGKEFSLRARASNFSLSDIKEGCEFAHQHQAKVYVTMNIVPHNDDLVGLEEYLLALVECKVDAIIVASMHIAQTAIKVAPSLEVHLSTQMSISNSSAVNFISNLGLKRIVLAREVTLAQIAQIKQNTTAELEVFIHGGMCASFSGRCMLSNYMTNRDANRGGCAHSCRWNYTLMNDEKIINDNNEFFNMGSKDLMAIKQIPKLIEIGVESLKIEGRMKSVYYIATVVRTYRNLIDDYYSGKEIDYDFYLEEISKAENRLSSTGFLLGPPTPNEQLYNMRSEVPTKTFVGYVLDYDEESQMALIEQRNYFSPFEVLEFFGPKLNNTQYQIGKIYDEELNELEVARHPQQRLKIFVPFRLSKHDMVRLVRE